MFHVLIKISFKFDIEGLMDNKSNLTWLGANQEASHSLPEPMMTQFTDAYLFQQTSVS